MTAEERQDTGLEQRRAVVDFFDWSYPWWRQVYDRNLPRGFFSFEMIRRKEVVLEVVRDYLQDRFGLNILECGCGPGGVLRELPMTEQRVFGLDINPESLRIVRQDCQQAQLVCGDLERLPFTAATFDIVLCVGVLSYLREDREALVELSRLLKPGGLLVLANPNLFMFDKLLDPFYPLVRPFTRLRQLIRKSEGKRPAGFTSCMIRRYRYGQLDQLYRELGLNKTREVCISYGPLRFWRKECLPVAQSIRISEALVHLTPHRGFGFLTRLANHWVTCLEKPARISAEEI